MEPAPRVVNGRPGAGDGFALDTGSGADCPLRMAGLPRISDTEWELMRIIWARQPVTSAEIIGTLREADPTWHPVTAKTLLNRLVKKGVLSHTRQGRAYLYRARVEEGACVAAATRAFLDRVFGGSVERMTAHLTGTRRPALTTTAPAGGISRKARGRRPGGSPRSGA